MATTMLEPGVDRFVQRPDAATNPPNTVLEPGHAVICRGVRVGVVVEVLPAWPATPPTHLLVELTLPTPRRVIVPWRELAAVGAGWVVLRGGLRRLTRLPAQPTDAELAAEIRAALAAAPIFQPKAAGAIQVAVADRTARLQGNVRSLLHGLEAEQIAGGVRGVCEVQNTLISDEELLSEISRLLRRDARLHDSAIHAALDLGKVRLHGQVSTPEQCALAVLLARRVPGVRAVRNAIVVRPRGERDYPPQIAEPRAAQLRQRAAAHSG